MRVLADATGPPGIDVEALAPGHPPLSDLLGPPGDESECCALTRVAVIFLLAFGREYVLVL